MGVHPAEDSADVGSHDVSFYCDDIHGTVQALKERGVPFTKDVEDHGYGLVTYFTAPGGVTVQLYEPRYVKRSAAKPKRPSRSASTKGRRQATVRKTKKPARRKTRK
jgi:hypothetical protein